MPNYELVAIFDGAQDDEAIHASRDRIREILASQAADITYVEDWGRRRMAYPIRKKTEGYYTIFYFRSSAGKVLHEEIERYTRITDIVLRQMMVSVPKLKTEADAQREEALREAERRALAEAQARSREAQAARAEAAGTPSEAPAEAETPSEKPDEAETAAEMPAGSESSPETPPEAAEAETAEAGPKESVATEAPPAEAAAADETPPAPETDAEERKVEAPAPSAPDA